MTAPIDAAPAAHQPEQPIHDLLSRRFSPRAFHPQIPSSEQLRAMYSAAAWAPSAFNSQPWRFVVGCRPDPGWQAILACLDDDNRRWAGSAPVLSLNLAATRSGEFDLPMAIYDLGQAVAHLTIEAMSSGIYVHQMSGFDPGAARRAFAVPQDHSVVTVMAIGMLGSLETLPRDLRERETKVRERHGLRGIAFAGSFGTPAPWAT